MGKQRTRASRSGAGLAIKRMSVHQPVAPLVTAQADGFDRRQLSGNRSVTALLDRDPVVVDAGHRSEHEAEHAERSPAAELGGGGSAPIGTGGSRLPTHVQRSIEERTGSDLSGLRVHHDRSAETLADSLGAEAVSHGGNVFFGSGQYSPGTSAGQDLLTHEAIHATRHDTNQVHLKRSKKHVDFVRMKRKKTHITRMLTGKALRAVGADQMAEGVEQDLDFYGHWWVEVGTLSLTGEWTPVRSYGWWPTDSVNIAQTLKIERIEGELNQGDHNDPHHGEDADIEFHPVMEVDDALGYDTIQQNLLRDIDNFATSFSGSWNWRLSWGKNCHTFQERMKKQLHLHNQKSKQWLRDPNAGAKQQAAVQAQAKNEFFEPWKSMRDAGDFINVRPDSYNLPDTIDLKYLLTLTDEQKLEILTYIGCNAENLNWFVQSEFGHRGNPIFT